MAIDYFSMRDTRSLSEEQRTLQTTVQINEAKATQ